MRRKKIVFVTGICVLVLAFGLGTVFGSMINIRQVLAGEDGTVDITQVIDLYQKTRSSEVSFDQFWRVWSEIKDQYVDQPIDETKMFYGAIEGMVAGLGDPYSVYLPPTQAKQFADDLSGEFEGIGAEIGIRDDQLTVIAPLPGSPAEQAGLRPGDKIYLIDDIETQGITVEEAVTHIRGKGGTTVTLSISHDGLDELKEIIITRAKINIPSVIVEMESDGIAYVRISTFNEETLTQFNKAIKDILSSDKSGMILDLRSNPGGFLDSAINIASEWISDGIIVRERMQNDNYKDHATTGSHRLAGFQTVVLVDEGSASASEIVAGALQDYGVATLVGAQTFGKGSVQNFEVLPDGSALKLTIAKWFTPKDRQIDGDGITPDVVLEEMFKEDSAAKNGFVDLGREKARELLTR